MPDGTCVNSKVDCFTLALRADDASEQELIAAPVSWADGLHDNLWNPPADTRHL